MNVRVFFIDLCVLEMNALCNDLNHLINMKI